MYAGCSGVGGGLCEVFTLNLGDYLEVYSSFLVSFLAKSSGWTVMSTYGGVDLQSGRVFYNFTMLLSLRGARVDDCVIMGEKHCFQESCGMQVKVELRGWYRVAYSLIYLVWLRVL